MGPRLPAVASGRRSPKPRCRKPSPFLIYQESRLIIRALRDYMRADIGEILVDTPEMYAEAQEFVAQTMPHNLRKLKHYTDDTPLFNRFQIESQIENAYERTVRLPSGGALVIDQTEALTAIDVNSARATKGGDIEETAFNTNLEAAEEVARQMRLRDLGGLVVIDFIDMSSSKHQRDVENKLQHALKFDRARVQLGRISKFGLMEMSRQRLSASLGESSQLVCPRCEGHGRMRSVESLSLSIIRVAEEHAMKENTGQVLVQAPVEIANYLLNEKRRALSEIEQRHDAPIVIVADEQLHTPHYEVTRIRDNELDEETSKPSYRRGTPRKLATIALTKANLNVPAAAAVTNVRPAQPAPLREPRPEPELAPVAASRPAPASAPAAVATGGVIGWLKNLFGSDAHDEGPCSARAHRRKIAAAATSVAAIATTSAAMAVAESRARVAVAIAIVVAATSRVAKARASRMRRRSRTRTRRPAGSRRSSKAASSRNRRASRTSRSRTQPRQNAKPRGDEQRGDDAMQSASDRTPRRSKRSCPLPSSPCKPRLPLQPAAAPAMTDATPVAERDVASMDDAAGGFECRTRRRQGRRWRRQPPSSRTSRWSPSPSWQRRSGHRRNGGDDNQASGDDSTMAADRSQPEFDFDDDARRRNRRSSSRHGPAQRRSCLHRLWRRPTTSPPACRPRTRTWTCCRSKPRRNNADDTSDVDASRPAMASFDEPQPEAAPVIMHGNADLSEPLVESQPVRGCGAGSRRRRGTTGRAGNGRGRGAGNAWSRRRSSFPRRNQSAIPSPEPRAATPVATTATG